MIATIMASFMLPLISSQGEGMSDSRGGGDVDAAAQLTYILTNPVEYLGTVGRFLASYNAPATFVEGFGWLLYIAPTPFELPLGVAALVLIVFFTFTDRREADLAYARWSIRLSTLAGYLIALALSATALYITFTAVASSEMAGMQPRYVLPLVFPLCAMVFNINLVDKHPRIQSTTAYSLASTVALWALCLAFVGLRFIAFF
jgi:uncharacterized membrane protein